MTVCLEVGGSCKGKGAYIVNWLQFVRDFYWLSRKG